MQFNIPKRISCLALLFLLLPLAAGYSFPANSWKHLSSRHFVVSYSERTAAIARKAVSIAEETYGSLASYFGYPRGGRKISIVLLDQSDDSNGATSLREPLVTVDCRKTQSLFRGETDWLRTVLSHELSHAYSLKTLTPPLVVGTTVGASSNAENFAVAATHWWGVNEVPEWFLEGIAQLGSYHFKADFRDPIREMILRDAVLNGTVLTLDEMSRFEGTSLDYELAYNQGFSFILFLEETYGGVTLKKLCTATAEKGLTRALEASYGKAAEALYKEWRQSLEDRFAVGETWSAGQRFAERSDPMGIEASWVKGGEFVIANWGNDYTRFSLFRKAHNGPYVELFRDTGLVLKEDGSTGDVWFNARVYNYDTGVDDYDVFRAGPDGRVSRVTRGARCLALDARDDYLAYARYHDGTTDIVLRSPDGTESAMYTAAAGSAVYSISLISRDTALLTVGTGDGVRLGILANHQLEYLWKDQEIIDAASAGEDRIVFSSTFSGSPQVYWADLRENPKAWYQVTGASGGARFPAVGVAAGSTTVSFSVFEKGGYHLYLLDDPFTRDHPVEIDGEAIAEPTPTEPEGAVWPASRAQANVIFGSPTFSVQLFANRYGSVLGTETIPFVAVGASESVFNAPGNVGLDASATVFSNIIPGSQVVMDISGSLTGHFDLWHLQNLVQYSVMTESYYLGGGITFSFIQNDVYAQTQLQVASHHFVSAYYDFSWLGDSMDASDIWYAAHTTGFRWQYSDSPASRFDPANLGQPLTAIYAGGDARYQFFPLSGAFDPSLYSMDPLWSFKLLAGTELRALLPGSRLSCDLRLDGFYLLEQMTPTLVTPYLQPTIGGETSFSGYPAGYARANSMAKGTLELRTNPFVNTTGRTAWYDRLSLGAKVEAGVIQYFSNGLALGFPVSVEASVRQYFYLSPSRESVAFLKVGVPLNDFMGTISLPLQLYGGYSY